MKRVLVVVMFLLAGIFILAQASWAQSEGVFSLQAQIPFAEQVVYIVSEVDPDTKDFVKLGTGDMSLEFPMGWDDVNNIWKANKIYAVDLSPSDASGDPAPGQLNTVTFEYVNDTFPNGPTGENLETKGTITVVNAGVSPEFQLQSTTLGDVDGDSIPGTLVAGGWMRVYLGLSTGEKGKPGKPFTNADAGGSYEGTLTIRSTLL